MDDEQAEAVALLALVAGQDVEPGERPGTWRIARKVAQDRVISTVDPQARHARKTSAQRRDGYKGHIAAEPETGLVTECALTAANAPDGPTGVGLLAAEAPGLEVLGDSGYGVWGDPRGAARRRPHPDDQADPTPERGAGRVHHPRLPHRHARPAWLRCPAGHGADHQLRPGQLRASVPAAARCAGAAPPPSGGRTIHLHPHEDELRAARRRATTRSFQQSYRRWRPMVERSIAWLVADGCRRVPYRGIERNDLWWSLRVAAVNLRRLLVLGLARQDGAWVLA